MEELVMVPVPRDRLTEVYALLGSNGAQASGKSSDSEDLDGWNAAEVRKHIGRASDTIKGLVNYLADHPGEEVGTEDVATALQLRYGWNSLAGALGAFGRYVGNRDLDFPWESWWDADGHAVMRMSDAMAAEVRKAGL